MNNFGIKEEQENAGHNPSFAVFDEIFEDMGLPEFQDVVEGKGRNCSKILVLCPRELPQCCHPLSGIAYDSQTQGPLCFASSEVGLQRMLSADSQRLFNSLGSGIGSPGGGVDDWDSFLNVLGTSKDPEVCATTSACLLSLLKPAGVLQASATRTARSHLPVWRTAGDSGILQ
jgi:hypothetical protein